MPQTNTKAIESMDSKEKEKLASSPQKKGVGEFVGEVKIELKKVEWTSKAELSLYTKLVLASTFIMGMAIYFMDLIIHGFLDGINLLFKIIFG